MADIDKEIQEYKHFAFSQNMIQVAIGLILVAAFQKTVTAVSDCLIMPIVNYFINATNGNWRDLKFEPLVGMNLEIGHLIGAILDFTILTLLLYLIYTKIVKRIWPELGVVTEKKEVIYLKRNDDGKWKIL
jgi:large conductance mechanosensitive channel protein